MLNIEQFLNTDELFDGHYALIRPLSVDGATADVWLALDTNTVTEDVTVSDIARLQDDEIDKLGLMVAIKIYRPQNALDIEGEERFRDEYMIVFNCHHTNLIHPTHFSIFRETPYLVLPYCKLGSSELLVGNLIGNDNIWKYIKDVSAGLAYLHALTPPIIHQDIKPANILLDDTNHYAITDFGISSQRGGTHEFYNDEENSGTLAYMAPERFSEGAEPMPQSDIWAFGATLCEILTGKVPFGEEGGKTQVERDVAMPKIPNVSSDIQRLIHACLSKEPGNRPSAEKIFKAAEAKQFPIKSKKTLYAFLITIFVILLGTASYFLLKPTPVIDTPRLSDKEFYDIALKKLDTENVDTLKAGLAIMDSLSNAGYIPAIYQMAFTYGWYSESISVKRKEMLGIAVGKDYMPTSDKYNDKAVALFTRILEYNDTSFADTNAIAAYRMACYYVMPNKRFKLNYERGEFFLLRAEEWAKKANNKELLNKIRKGLNNLRNRE